MMPARETEISRLEAEALVEDWFTAWQKEHLGKRATPPKQPPTGAPMSAPAPVTPPVQGPQGY